MERLDASLQGRLTLVSAPAGFGKTTLLAEWVHRCRGGVSPPTPGEDTGPAPSRASPPLRVAWLSLDPGDNDPARFWAYILAALRAIPGLDAIAEALAPDSLPGEPHLANLLNEIGQSPQRVVLILDDYHLIAERRIHDALNYLVGHLPGQMHLVVSTRSDPPWPLARLRALGEMAELRARDLRFTSEETLAFLQSSLGTAPEAEDVVALEQRTEGWIAGLQMAALSLQGRKDATTFIRAFTGSHRFILDYLMEEVLDRQPPAVRGFLLQTSILDRLTAPLCDAVTERQDSGDLLRRIERANLFLVPLDDERRWYRYHHLFADLLRSLLEQTQPDQMRALHLRAGAWYEENGLIAEAVSHALAGGDAQHAAQLVAGNALAMVEQGELSLLVRRLGALPRDDAQAHPWLCVVHAWALAYSGELDRVPAQLRAAEEAVSALAGMAAQHVHGQVAAIRAYVAWVRGDAPSGERFARQALAALPEDDRTARGLAQTTLGTALTLRGDLAAAADAFSEAMTTSRAAGNTHVAMLAASGLAYLRIQQGQLHHAADTCRQTLAPAEARELRGGRPLPAAGNTHAILSDVLREWNDLQGAAHQAREGLALSRAWGQADSLVVSCVSLARVLEAQGDVDGALAAVLEARRVARAVSPWFGAIVAATEARVRLAQGDVAGAAHWAQGCGLSADDKFRFDPDEVYCLLARVLIVRGQPDEALRLLARLLQASEAAGAQGVAIQTLAVQALAQQALGRQEEALDSLARAL